jgi:hypothetical protein
MLTLSGSSAVEIGCSLGGRHEGIVTEDHSDPFLSRSER